MGSSKSGNENRPRRILPRACIIPVFIVIVGCLLLSWFIFQDANSPLPEYPNAEDIHVEYLDEEYCCTETITTFETVDTPEEVYTFYRDEFKFRFKWRPESTESGLSYSHSMGCPVGSYRITAEQVGDHTEVAIRLSTHVCI